MNKKGDYELANIAGIFLIILLSASFGFLFTKGIPQTQVEILEDEHGNYLARQDMLYFLDYKIGNFNVADKILLGVKNNNLTFLDEIGGEIFKDSSVNYWIYVAKSGKFLKEVEIQGKKPVYSKPEELKYNFVKILYGPDGEEVLVGLTRYYLA